MKLLVLSRYGRLGASSRLRTMQYLPWLEAQGFSVRFEPFFDDKYLEDLYGGRSARLRSASYYLSRMRSMWKSGSTDMIWLEKELLPWLPWFVERQFLPRDVPIVSDYDDAVFHRYDLHRNPLVRGALGSKLDRLMKASALILAGNPYLAERARKAGASRVEIVPTVVDSTSYHTQALPSQDGLPRIGWIGSPSTWRSYMQPMLPMLTGIAQKKSARIRAVGAGVPGTEVLESLPWDEAGESRMIQGMDIGLMPLDDSPWSRGKCGYKIIQYMSCGVPVVASPTGVNADIVEDGVTGFLATTEAEWGRAITRLLDDPALRRRMGRAGRQRMEERYSLQLWAPQVACLLASCLPLKG